jgi:hypothetical protein
MSSITAYNSEVITIGDTAIGFDSDIYTENQTFIVGKVVFIVELAPIRVRVDGKDPTATTGMPFNIGDIITVQDEHDIKKFKAIKTGPSDAKIQPTYFRGW